MGQRSQIYIRYNKAEENKKGLMATYFSWNFGGRMVSRARGIMEWVLSEEYRRKNLYYKEYLTRLQAVVNTNFDMRDVLLTSSCINEWLEEAPQEPFNEYVFLEQDNNNGKLFIDIQKDAIKYCFTNGDADEPYDAHEYMLVENDGDHDWKQKVVEEGYWDEEDIEIYENNVKYISEHASLMTREELREFINYDYLADNNNFQPEEPQEKKIYADKGYEVLDSLFAKIQKNNYIATQEMFDEAWVNWINLENA